MEGGMRAILILAITSSVGVMTVFLACALPGFGNWSPLSVVFFYLLAPAPLIVSQKLSGGSSFGDEGGAGEGAMFLATIFVLSSFGLPMVLCHAGVITLGAMLLTLLGNLFVFGSMLAYGLVFSDTDF
eukprot:comp19382_c0_seq1/m.22364 comp19382_c0_seq1/g.22364  ORF comp19382_c0_seq1/g.22364 comp19382_c0_seq1/m.22364 type:complete len:128 (-) comp19382_c0_seq1:151-534(-)